MLRATNVNVSKMSSPWLTFLGNLDDLPLFYYLASRLLRAAVKCPRGSPRRRHQRAETSKPSLAQLSHSSRIPLTCGVSCKIDGKSQVDGCTCRPSLKSDRVSAAAALRRTVQAASTSQSWASAGFLWPVKPCRVYDGAQRITSTFCQQH